MAGGKFYFQNKVRPGAYINFSSDALLNITPKDRGCVALPLPLSFAQNNKIIKLTDDTDFEKILGASISHPDLFLVREAFKRAKTILLYKINGGTCAKISSNGLDVLAKFPGSLGNKISIRINNTPYISGDRAFKITTLLDNKIVHEQTILSGESPNDNNFVSFIKTSDITETTAIFLKGGKDDVPTADDYSLFFKELTLHNFDALAMPVTDIDIINASISFIKRLREDEGMKSVLVVSGAKAPDYEGVINVANGVVLEDSTYIPAHMATSWVAGATASAQINQSLTFDRYDGAISASPMFSNTDIIERLCAGEFIFTTNDDNATIESDINSFTGVLPTKSKFFSKNRVIRVIDSIANDIRRTFEENYIGKISNDDIGRTLFKNDCINYLNTLSEASAITNFSPKTDISVERGADIDSVIAHLSIMPVDSMEKLYMSVTLS